MFPLESSLSTVAFPLQFGVVAAAALHVAPTAKPPLLAWLTLSASE
jgi:hypothetical protein